MTQLASVLLAFVAAAAIAWLRCPAPVATGVRATPADCAGVAGVSALACAALAVAAAEFAANVATGLPAWALWAALVACVGVGVLQGDRIWRLGVRPRAGYERVASWALGFCAALAILVSVGIVYAVLAESVRFFSVISVFNFLFGLEWSPQIAIRADQEGSSGRFGVVPLIVGTMLISVIAMAVAIPIGLLTAIYLSEFADVRTRDTIKPALEFLAGIPTVVYGFFAVVTLGPMLRDLGSLAGLSISSESALAAGLVIGVMTIPFVASLSEDALHAVPDDLRQGSLALGATRSESALKVAVPAGLPGIAAGCLLAFSRAVGETMIVVMAAGLAANLTFNPIESATTMTVQIVTLLVGDQQFDDPKTLAAFALGLALFVFTMALNVVGLRMVRKHHQRYD